MLRLMYHGKERILEPHDHGVLNGSVQLLGYQTAGSSSRPLPNWLFMKADEIVNLELLDQHFPGGRPTATGNRIRWDKLFIRPASGRTVTAALAHARDVLADRRLFVLDDAAWTQFVAILDRPVSHKPRLEKLFAEPSIFDPEA